jgi:hypothetical protein
MGATPERANKLTVTDHRDPASRKESSDVGPGLAVVEVSRPSV